MTIKREAARNNQAASLLRKLFNKAFNYDILNLKDFRKLYGPDA